MGWDLRGNFEQQGNGVAIYRPGKVCSPLLLKETFCCFQRLYP
jgi:hypothetical protein